jgi:type III secretion protein U
MAKQQQGAEQTEKPTQKRLNDARRDGDIAKSKELTSTVLVLCWLVMAWLAMPLVSAQVSGLMQRCLGAVSRLGGEPLAAILAQALRTLLGVLLPLMLAAVAMGLLSEFLQVGGLFAPKRVLPRGERLNPVEGISRMFSQDNLVEVLKSILKTAALIGIFVLVLLRMLPEVLRLPFGDVQDIGTAHWHTLMWVGIWTVCVFALIAATDALYQRFAFIKRMRMSRRDIRRELRDTEGDPFVKGRRRQLHQEWAQQNMLEAVRKSNAVVVNPEHIAVAILYQPGTTELPIVCAKGEDYEAQLIREAAEQAGVPIMRNVELARGLHESVGVDEYIHAQFFQAVAELLRWAEAVRQRR